ncbi:MAG: hypothetical protein QM831_12625 [Kofleriaceae bacterium]
MKQQDLLHESKAMIAVADTRREPRVWIRRIVIWSTPDKIIQDISFNCGLNIVWSPDTDNTKGKNKRKQKRRRGSGHGAGKTLLCRLIRYCLGEDTFARKELEDEVRKSFKDGLVGAEVIIDGAVWGVVRPIGIGRKTRVGENQSLEKLIEANGTGIEPLVAAIRASVLGSDLVDVIIGSHEARDWLHALAWLTRDQEARYNHLLEWRTGSSDSESPVANEIKDQLDDAARLLIGAMTADEVACKKHLAGVVATIARYERDGAYIARLVSELELETLKIAGMDDFDGTAALAIPQAAARIREQIEAAERPVDESPLTPLRARLDEQLAEQGRLSGEQARLNSVVTLHNSNLNQLNGELTKLSAREIEAQLGTSYCPICSVAIDRALAEGCGLAVMPPDPAQAAADFDATERARTTCESALRDCRKQLGTIERQASEVTRRVGQLRLEITRLETQLRQQRDSQHSQWRTATRAQLGIERLDKMRVRRDEYESGLQGQKTKKDQLSQKLEAHRNKNATVIRRWNALFQLVCSEIYGEDIACQLTLTGKGLQAKMPTGGLAMEALKVIAFDLATMLMSVEGKSRMPALLIHDSPREADLGEPLYHGVFHAVVELERRTNMKAPPFQYIITTTSAPPDDLEDRVVLRLGSNDASERLLGRDLA